MAQNYFPNNASSITTGDIIKRLAGNGHHITLLAPRRCQTDCERNCSLKCEASEAVTVKLIPTVVPYYLINERNVMGSLVLALFQAFLVLNALKICAKRQFDVIVSQHHPSHLASLSAFTLSRILRIPLVIKTHDVYNSSSDIFQTLFLRALDNLYRMVFKRAALMFVVSSSLRLKVIQTYKLGVDKVLVLPNGVDTRKFRHGLDEAELLRRRLAGDNQAILLFVGRIREERGLTVLIKAMRAIIAKNPRLLVVFIGGGAQKSEVENLVYELDLEDFVRFIPVVDHDKMPTYINMSDITIGPLMANIDTFGSVPRKVLEYMACSKPVVTCRGGVSPDLITDGYNGFLFDRNDIEELSSIVLRLLNDPNLARTIGINARLHVETFYDWDKIVGGFEKSLQEVAGKAVAKKN